MSVLQLPTPFTPSMLESLQRVRQTVRSDDSVVVRTNTKAEYQATLIRPVEQTVALAVANYSTLLSRLAE